MSREEVELCIIENKVPRKIFGCKKNKVSSFRYYVMRDFMI
jgi:hypothetical protein